MRLSFAFFTLGGLAIAFGAPSSRNVHHVVHEKRTVEPLDWEMSRRLESHKILPVRIGLKQQNIGRIEDMLLSVSHPDSPDYGKHWSAKQVVDAFAPKEESIRAVLGWLQEFGISSDRPKISANKGWIHLNATTAEVEELLNTEYHVYTHTETGEEQIGIFSVSPWYHSYTDH